MSIHESLKKNKKNSIIFMIVSVLAFLLSLLILFWLKIDTNIIRIILLFEILTIYIARNRMWKCPSCKKPLGKHLNPKYCPHCSVSFQESNDNIHSEIDAVLVGKFSAILTRQKIVGIIFFVIFTPLLIVRYFLPGESDIISGNIGLILILFFIATTTLYSRYNWKCPNCNKYLGKNVINHSCPNCGVRLKE